MGLAHNMFREAAHLACLLASISIKATPHTVSCRTTPQIVRTIRISVARCTAFLPAALSTLIGNAIRFVLPLLLWLLPQEVVLVYQVVPQISISLTDQLINV